MKKFSPVVIKYNYADIIRRCNQLTNAEKPFKITWDRRTVDPLIRLMVDRRTYYPVDQIDHELIEFVKTEIIGPYNVGEYATHGQVTYCRETRTFSGVGEYRKHHFDSKSCQIRISVPADLWFDRLEISVDTEEEDEVPSICRLLFAHGPRLDKHDRIEEAVVQNLLFDIKKLTKSIPGFRYATLSGVFPRSAFVQADHDFFVVLERFGYGWSEYVPRQIHIRLKK